MTDVTPARSTRASRHWMNSPQSRYRYSTSPSGTEYTTCGRCDSTFRTGPQCGCSPRERRDRATTRRVEGSPSPYMRTHPILAITQEGRQEEERAAAKKARVRERARARKEREDLAADRALVAEMESAEREQVEAFRRWQEAREREARQAAVNQTREALERRRGEITPTQP